MKPAPIPVEKIRALEPTCLRKIIPEEHRDGNSHMNVRWYATIFDEAADPLHDRLGLPETFHRDNGTGTMDLENHINYLHEVIPGECIAVFARLVAQSAKRMHYVMFMVNETRGNLAATFECINAFVDLKARKTAPFPAEVAAKLEAEVAASSALDWQPPLCGAMTA